MPHQLSRRHMLQLVTASVAGLGLAACGSNGSGSDAVGGDGDSGQITVWSWTTAAKALRAVVPSFERDNPGITVDIQDVGEPAIWDKITVGLASGGKGLADVLHIGVDYLPGYLEKFPDGLADLSRLGADQYKGAFAQGLWPTVIGEDKAAHALPWEVNPLGLFYRQDYFEKAGVDPASISSWDDLIAAGPKILAATGAQLLGLDKPGTTQDMNFFQNLMQLQGAFYFDHDGKVTLASPAAVQALTVIKRLNDGGLLADTAGQGTWKRLVGQGKLATSPDPAWAVEYLATKFPDQSGKWRVMQPPAAVPGGGRGAIVNSTYLAVSASSKRRRAAWRFIEYALTKPAEINRMFASGGVFPALSAAYTDPKFSAPHPFYGGQKVLKSFVDSLGSGSDATNFTGDYARALKLASDAQSQVLLKGADPAGALKGAAEQLAQQTGRQQAA
ncbi:sugar ABC transporter substrate-binding protein [Streptomyces sp. Ncost-T10-10d]|uniref:ABC transporter substrate-binding protein n=1 Tax=Streptomyces sp. Ncost-T10-10d TaxID=1839774 RepID=UPI00081E2592|nr:sugar ABC transporter substrate-binding protein [Streptomyces sp. Ncost-T10-10d]SCF56913.1 carbohydrate ABC transporter substrate-binding protein, CUT1 family [Streptomyces sp. Ncost-T10-10d]